MSADEPTVKGLLISVKDNNATCYSEQFESIITVRVPSNLRILQGQNLLFSEFDLQKNVFIPNPNSRTTRAEDNHKVIRRGSIFLVKAIAARSSTPGHQTFQKKLAYAGSFGLVELKDVVFPKKGTAYHVLLAVNNAEAAKESRGSAFKLSSVGKETSIVDSVEFMKTVMDFEERNLDRCVKWGIPDPSATEGYHQIRNGPSNSAVTPPLIRENARDCTNNRMIASSAAHSSHSSTNSNSYTLPLQSPIAPSPLIRPNEIVSTAMVITRNKDFFIVYLTETCSAATLRINQVPGPSVRVGTVFKCLIAPHEQNGIYWDVKEVLNIIEMRNEILITQDDKCYSLFSIDLSTQDAIYVNNWVESGGNPIVESEVGPVIIADTVIDPTGNKISCHQLISKYIGKEMSKEMLGWCEFVQYDVPRMILDRDYVGEQTLYQYGWRLVEVTATADQFYRMDRNLKERNLGPHLRYLEAEDDVARQKRLNKEAAEVSPYNLRAPSVVGETGSTIERGSGASSSNFRQFANGDSFETHQEYPEIEHDRTHSSASYSRQNSDYNDQRRSPNSSRGGRSMLSTIELKNLLICELQEMLKRAVTIVENVFEEGSKATRTMKLENTGNPKALEEALQTCAEVLSSFNARKHHLLKKV